MEFKIIFMVNCFISFTSDAMDLYEFMVKYLENHKGVSRIISAQELRNFKEPSKDRTIAIGIVTKDSRTQMAEIYLCKRLNLPIILFISERVSTPFRKELYSLPPYTAIKFQTRVEFQGHLFEMSNAIERLEPRLDDFSKYISTTRPIKTPPRIEIKQKTVDKPKKNPIIAESERLLDEGKLYDAKNLIESFLKTEPDNKSAIEIDHKIKKIIEDRLGPSSHTTTDRWAEKDTLGYWVYVEAISQFLIHGETKSPLSISIQAPWGGGKTTIMRLIQEELDPDEYERTLKTINGIANEKSESLSHKLLLKNLLGEIGIVTEEKIDFGINENQRLTIWFNAWKYDSNNQIWAGLATSIIKQLSDRLSVEQREQFWLLINKERMNAQGISRRIKERKFSAWINALKTELWKPGVAFFSSLATAFFGGSLQFGEYVGVAGIIASIFWGYKKSMKEKAETAKEIDDEPANAMFKDYIEIPDYTKEVGFVHHVDDDLRRILKVIETKYNKPIIIFIDDLDRCSPRKIADVVEALNRFLSAEFPSCIFVLGMDAEMVAASLEEAHKDVISKLPLHASTTPIGWRFMDKFIQLPVIVPPPEKSDRDFYLENLIGANKTSTNSDTHHVYSSPIGPHNTVNSEQNHNWKISKTSNKDVTSKNKDPTLEKFTDVVSKYELDRRLTISEIQDTVKKYSDDNQTIRHLIKKDEKHFSDNPREIKRFVNLYRFFFFLRTLREARKQRHPDMKLATDEQIANWIILTLKWPSALRWILRSTGETAYKADLDLPMSTPKERLYLLEKLAKENKVEKWQDKLAKILQVKADESVYWITDKDFRIFMQNADLSKAENVGFY